MKYLVAKRASLQAKTDEGVQPIHSASERGHLEIVKYLVGKGVSVLAKNDIDWQPIHYAIRWGHLEIVKYLVSTGKVSKRMGGCE